MKSASSFCHSKKKSSGFPSSSLWTLLIPFSASNLQIGWKNASMKGILSSRLKGIWTSRWIQKSPELSCCPLQWAVSKVIHQEHIYELTNSKYSEQRSRSHYAEGWMPKEKICRLDQTWKDRGFEKAKRDWAKRTADPKLAERAHQR